MYTAVYKRVGIDHSAGTCRGGSELHIGEVLVKETLVTLFLPLFEKTSVGPV